MPAEWETNKVDWKKLIIKSVNTFTKNVTVGRGLCLGYLFERRNRSLGHTSATGESEGSFSIPPTIPVEKVSSANSTVEGRRGVRQGTGFLTRWGRARATAADRSRKE